jgi:hypothetical protein
VTESEKCLVLDLLNANSKLTGAQACEFARRVLAAERVENYAQMQRIIQEAAFGPASDQTAA